MQGMPKGNLQQPSRQLFELGGLRIDDHFGLQTVLSASGSKLLPMVVLDESNLGKLPVAHAADNGWIMHPWHE